MAQEFKPYIPAETKMTEFTWSAVLLGTALGLIFSASSLYLVLKVGMTVSASIPVAVLAITLFRGFSRAFGLRQATILENNIVQTAGSAGESIAFGVGVTMPAFLLLGFDMELTRVMVVSILGGLLGILAMIPLRRAFIVNMHGRPGQPGTLLYPEGTACAQVLISGDKGGTTGQTVFIGFGLAFVHKFLTEGMGLLAGIVSVPLGFINRAAVFTTEMASEMLGVGYIIGFKTSAVMMAGAVLGYLVIIPTIYFIGESNPNYVPPAVKSIDVNKQTGEQTDLGLIKNMSIKDLRNNYLLYIGAGCVAAAGIFSMIKTMPLILRSVRAGLASVGAGGVVEKKRTENDMPMSVVLLGSVGLIIVLAAFLTTEVGVVSAILGAILVVLFGFLFVTVSARLTGEIGSSSNPISGMTVATLMLTCLIFLSLGMTSSSDRVLALSIAAVVCIASSNGGTTAQSLKTGFLVGATPKAAQWAILFGALVSALVIGGTLLALNDAGTVYTRKVPDFTLNTTELSRLKATTTYEGKSFKVFDPRTQEITAPDPKANYTPRPELLRLPVAHYLVDPETGKIAWIKDPAIMGKITERDDGSKVERGIDAPKTQVMGIIINGVLKQELNWSMVAIGAMIAVMLELCGISALAFAVGVYVPIQYSAPIFIGGIIRYLVDKYLAATTKVERKPEESDAEYAGRVEIESIRRSETSPGVLLASGYIAGGSLAGVCAAFLEFPAAKAIKDSIDLKYVLANLPGQTVDLIVTGVFAVLVVLLLSVGTGRLFGGKDEGTGNSR
jgi:putative OPT family oligopeptide transporter